MPRKILVLAMDFDGCVFNRTYLHSKSANRLIETNGLFFEFVKQELSKNNYEQIILTVGSNRQSKELDYINSCMRSSESCFPAMIKLQNEINLRFKTPCNVNPILLTDVFNDRKSGDTFNHALENDKNYEFPRSIWDANKTTIPYTHMHDIASENSDAEITYCFLDDSTNILGELFTNYSEFDCLIPANTTFNFFFYDGTQLEKYKHLENDATLPGKGIIDRDYKANVNLIAKVCGITINNQQNFNKGISAKFHGSMIREFLLKRQMNEETQLQELETELKRLTKKSHYTKENWDSLITALEYLNDELRKNNSEKVSQLVRATTNMVRYLQLDNLTDGSIINCERNETLKEFIKEFSVSNTSASPRLFGTRHNYLAAANEVADRLKEIVNCDELEFNSAARKTA